MSLEMSTVLLKCLQCSYLMSLTGHWYCPVSFETKIAATFPGIPFLQEQGALNTKKVYRWAWKSISWVTKRHLAGDRSLEAAGFSFRVATPPSYFLGCHFLMYSWKAGACTVMHTMITNLRLRKPALIHAVLVNSYLAVTSLKRWTFETRAVELLTNNIPSDCLQLDFDIIREIPVCYWASLQVKQPCLLLS